MIYRVRLTAKAEQDIAERLAWFADQHAAVAGGRWFGKLMKSVATLESMPQRCAIIGEAADLDREVRELRFGRRRNVYRVIFEIQGSIVIVLRLRNASQDQLTHDDLMET